MFVERTLLAVFLILAGMAGIFVGSKIVINQADENRVIVSTPEKTNEGRFSCRYLKDVSNDLHLYLVKDNESGCQYMIAQSVNCAALTSFEIKKKEQQ